MRRSLSRRGPTKGRIGEAVQTEAKCGVGHGGRGVGKKRSDQTASIRRGWRSELQKTKTETGGKEGGGARKEIKTVGEATTGE